MAQIPAAMGTTVSNADSGIQNDNRRSNIQTLTSECSKHCGCKLHLAAVSHQQCFQNANDVSRFLNESQVEHLMKHNCINKNVTKGSGCLSVMLRRRRKMYLTVRVTEMLSMKPGKIAQAQPKTRALQSELYQIPLFLCSLL